MTIAALYIDPRGPYPRMSAGRALDNREPADPYARPWGVIDCWDATRDARLYAGPHPVVAHPPCKHWGRLRHLAHVECRNVFCKMSLRAGDVADNGACPYCDEHRIDWNDRDCAPRAVEQVRAYGGVLEHPAGSLLWRDCDLPDAVSHALVQRRPKPGEFDVLIPRDAHGGYTIEIDQCEWGHVARKRTWLYLVGVPRDALEAPPFPGREPTHWISGGRGRQGKKAKTTPVPPGIKVASAQQRRRTPPLFAEYLVRLARAAQK